MLILSGVHHQPCHDMGGSVWCPHQGSWSQGSFVDSRLPVPVLTQKGQNEVTLMYILGILTSTDKNSHTSET